MPIEVLMPALSPTMEKGNLAKWLKKEGDRIKSGDIIAEIETDKATMEVEAVDEGVVEALLVPEGTEEVKVNTPIARLKGQGAERRDSPPSAAAPPAPPGGGRTEVKAAAASPPPLEEGGEKRGRALGADHASANDLAIELAPADGGNGVIAEDDEEAAIAQMVMAEFMDEAAVETAESGGVRVRLRKHRPQA